ncbi:MAG: hypothetical protein EPO65_08505, partial [Dehalococcoidia bacterium]
MLRHLFWAPATVILTFVIGCGASRVPTPSTPTSPPSTPVTSTPAPTSSTSATPTAVPTPATVRLDLRASRLAIPSLGIDAPVGGSLVVPDTSPPTPGCPPRPPGGTTFTVPNQGIVTPVDAIEGLENKAWIFGHSRWQGQAGILLSLQYLNVGDEVFVDGVDRLTGERLTQRKFVVSGLYLTDIDSGGKLVTAGSASEIPAKPLVILQTSVREDGANKQWILSRPTIEAKARNLIEGDVNDPCKYLLLFVF